jgi:acetyltransferase-like isoleucine patch superfamily enzyme
MRAFSFTAGTLSRRARSHRSRPVASLALCAVRRITCGGVKTAILSAVRRLASDAVARVDGERWLALYRWTRLARSMLFSRMVAGSFMEFGSDSVIELPVTIHGESRIAIGSNVYIGPGSWLFTRGEEALLEIGDGTRMSGMCVVSAVSRVRLGRSVLLGRNVYIADNNHGSSDASVPIADQELEKIAPVTIEDGAWLGQNTVILSGVTVGAGAVVGANSVVLEDVPPRAVAVGAPAKVVRWLDRSP